MTEEQQHIYLLNRTALDFIKDSKYTVYSQLTVKFNMKENEMVDSHHLHCTFSIQLPLICRAFK